jgi:D-sedoheptulose 7-phosphate isomerase
MAEEQFGKKRLKEMITKNKINSSFYNDIDNNIKYHRDLIKHKKRVKEIIDKISKCIISGHKIMICGNGGSAADAQHLAAEFIVRLRPKIKRQPYPVITLAQDTSSLTACGNDYDFSDIFLRPFQALYKKGDIVIAISTSGNSKNIIKLLNYANKRKIYSIGLLGNKGGMAKKYCNNSIIINGSITARIQECHIFLGHFIFEQVEDLLIKKIRRK